MQVGDFVLISYRNQEDELGFIESESECKFLWQVRVDGKLRSYCKGTLDRNRDQRLNRHVLSWITKITEKERMTFIKNKIELARLEELRQAVENLDPDRDSKLVEPLLSMYRNYVNERRTKNDEPKQKLS